MEVFLEDYPGGREAGRYLDAALPRLPFADHSFDLALCANFLFLYSSQHDLDFHVQALLELVRVAREVRVFPLMELGSVLSRHVDSGTDALRGHGLVVDSIQVPYELQRGGNRMMGITQSA
jgi:hypothetical protein